MAGIRSRGYDALLGASPARGGTDQVEPAEDHRRWYRLAFSERAQARAEGVSRKRGTLMPNMQTRRHFLTGAALSGAASLARGPALMAAERPLETTTVR